MLAWSISEIFQEVFKKEKKRKTLWLYVRKSGSQQFKTHHSLQSLLCSNTAAHRRDRWTRCPHGVCGFAASASCLVLYEILLRTSTALPSHGLTAFSRHPQWITVVPQEPEKLVSHPLSSRMQGGHRARMGPGLLLALGLTQRPTRTGRSTNSFI